MAILRFLQTRPDARQEEIARHIFVAAEKNGFACYGRSGNDFQRLILIFVAAKRMVPPAERHFPTAAVILDFRG